jgi:hypothetical protein
VRSGAVRTWDTPRPPGMPVARAAVVGTATVGDQPSNDLASFSESVFTFMPTSAIIVRSMIFAAVMALRA